MKKRLFKYCKKNNTDRNNSYYDGKNRIGYQMVTITSDAEEEAANKKGFYAGMPKMPEKKPKAAAPTVEAAPVDPVEKVENDNENSTLHTPEST